MEEEIENTDLTMVTFGSVIAISDFNDQNAFIFSDGFLKSSLVVRSFTQTNQKKRTFEGLDNDSFFKCLFQVLPRVSDTAKNQALKKIEETIERLEKQEKSEEFYDYKDRYKIKNIAEYLGALMNEYKQNIDTIEKSKNCKLTYHQPFQLLHVASGKFLAVYESESTYENQNYLVALADYSSDQTVFTIVPAYAYQSHGEQDVNAGEMCAITRAMPIQNRAAFLSCSQLELADLKYGSQITSETIIKRELNSSVEQSHSWKIVLFQQHIPETSRTLQVGDCIWLYHSEAEANLAVLKIKAAVDKDDFSGYGLSEWLSMGNLRVAAINQGSTSGLWQIEGAEQVQGGLVKFESGYLLRNVTTGYYLCVGRKGFELSRTRDRSGIFQFQDLKTQAHEKFVKGGSYTYILNSAVRQWVDMQKGKEGMYEPMLKEYTEKTEHAVFKIHLATKNEVWEIQFLLSCFRMLAKFLIRIQDQKFPGVEDFHYKKKWLPKFERARLCISELEDFVNNKAYTTSAEQIYGEINSTRQKLMREQFYIDLLVKILDRIITKGELEFYQKEKKSQIPKEGFIEMQEQNFVESELEEEGFALDDKVVDQNNKLQIVSYINSKVDLANQIYQFLGTVCKFNTNNQVYTFDLIPYFQLHTKYLPKAVNTIIDIVSSNQALQYKLSEGVRIDQQESMVDQKHINILINLYDAEDDYGDEQEEQIAVRQHEKITSKPVPLIVYFINLLWDEEAINNHFYLKFLRSICSFKGSAILINQENLFKLYKMNNTRNPRLGVETKAEESKFKDGAVRLSSKAGQLIIPKGCDKRSEQPEVRDRFTYIVEQLTFFSQVALGRNYFWKKELGAQFEKSFLFRNIWNDRPIDPRYEDLKPSFAQLALTLYIDQDPLKPRKAPQMCQLFSEIDVAPDLKVFKSSVDGSSNIQELNTYNDLIWNLVNYYRTLRGNLKNLIEPEKTEQIGNDIVVEIGDDILSQELILQSTVILEKVMKLQLVWVVDYSLKDEEDHRTINPQDFISEFVEVLLYIFQYEKFELQFVRAHAQTVKERVEAKLKQKFEPVGLQAAGFMNMFSNKKKEEDEGDEVRGDAQVMNEQHLYLNPVMRGYLKIQSRMQIFNYMDPIWVANEVQLKIKICDIFEYLLDLRHDFLLQNALIFFKYYVLQGDHIENDEPRMRRKMHEENKRNPKKQTRKHYDKLDRKDLNLMIIQRLLETHQPGLLPNLANTGLDSGTKDNTETFGFTNLINLKKEEAKMTCFFNYIREKNIEGIPEILDLDQYLSIMLRDTKPLDKPVGSLLPTLLNTFTNIQNKELEKKCLSLILKLFTQKETFKRNLENMQVLFDTEKTVLYKYLNKNMELFQRLLERIDNWLQMFIQDPNCVPEEFVKTFELLQCFNSGLMTDISEVDGRLVAQDETVDPQKQQLYANLECHEKIIHFLKEGLYYFSDSLLDMEIARPKKDQMIQLFSLAFTILSNFCFRNFDNQLLLYEHLGHFKFLQFELGQLDLIKFIFQNNKILLIQKVDSQIMQQFVSLIQKEGRQKRFLDVMEVLLSYKNKYLFDNQLIVLNALLPPELGEKELKVLYCDGSKPNNTRLHLDDPIHDPGLTFTEKLREIDYRDTFRDEPFHYHARLIDILIQTTLVEVDKRPFSVDRGEDVVKENFNISVSKLKRLFPVDYLLDLLRQKDAFGLKTVAGTMKLPDEDKMRGMSILKLLIVEFIRLVHISSERGQIQHSQLYYCEQQVVDVFESELRRLEKVTEAEQISDELTRYYFEGLLPFTVAYYERFLKRVIEQQVSRQDIKKDMGMIEKFLRLLFSKMVTLTAGENMLYPYITTADRSKLIQKCLSLYSHSFYLKLEHQLRDKIPNDDQLAALLRMEALIAESRPLINQDSEISILNSSVNRQKTFERQGSIKMEHRRRIPKKHIPKNKIFEMPEDEKLLENGYDRDCSQEVEEFWKLFVGELVGNDHFKKEADSERQCIANAFLNVTGLLDSKFTKQVQHKPDVKSVSRQLIYYLQSAFNDPNCKDSIQTLLSVLQKIIESDASRKQEMQNLFDKLGATQMVLLVLSENSKLTDKKLMMAFLQFINTMLEGGNNQVQKTIYHFMANFTQSENIFQKIYFIIRKQIENIEIMAKSKKQAADAGLGMLQIDEKEVEEDLKLVLQVLTFLQNAVEGHFLLLQNYFRIQVNSRNNYDLTIAITDLFKTYYYEGYYQKNYDNMLKCLDTLNELVQGPCQENQIAVSESKFLDIASDLFGRYQTEHTEPEADLTKKQPEQELRRWMVARLMNKILNLIISLLEGREISPSNNVLKRIMRNLPISLLERHAVIEFNKYTGIYKEKYEIQVLEHLNHDPRSMKRGERGIYLQKSPFYFESILQNGFLLFFLMSYYMECEPHLLSPIVQMHKQYKRKLLKSETSNLLMQFLKSSALYLAIKFSISLVEIIIGYLDSMKNLAADQLIKNDQVVPVSLEEEQKQREAKYRQDLEKAVSFYMVNSAHIDVMHEDNLEVVYFIKLPLTKYLPKEKKTEFHDQVDRSTTQSKVQGLVSQSATLIEVCKHEEYLIRLFDRQKTVALLTQYVQLWRELAFLLTLFLNLFILFSFTGGDSDDQRVNEYIFFDSEDFTVAQTKTLINLIGIVMTCLSIFVVSFFLLKNAPLILKRAWLQKGLFDGLDPNPAFQLIDLGYKMFLTLLSFLQEVEVMYYVAYGAFAVLGTAVHPFFFIFHLSEILFRYPTLKNVILSVYKPRTQLLLAFCLLLLLVYIFTIIAYQAIATENFGEYCNTLFYCFLMNIAWTFRGSIGNYVQEEIDVGNVAKDIGVGRFFFDEFSNIVLGVIMLNIVGGIIIDTFGSLREEEVEKNQDMVDKCFICGNLKADFDRLQSKTSGGFKEHIKINHYMWNYMYFIAYLKWKEKTDYSGIESYVSQKLLDEDLCWVPFNQARELKGIEGNDAGREKELLQKIEEKLKRAQEQIKEMAKQLKVEHR